MGALPVHMGYKWPSSAPADSNPIYPKPLATPFNLCSRQPWLGFPGASELAAATGAMDTCNFPACSPDWEWFQRFALDRPLQVSPQIQIHTATHLSIFFLFLLPLFPLCHAFLNTCISIPASPCQFPSCLQMNLPMPFYVCIVSLATIDLDSPPQVKYSFRCLAIQVTI